jgi:hypothetical protein
MALLWSRLIILELIETPQLPRPLSVIKQDFQVISFCLCTNEQKREGKKKALIKNVFSFLQRSKFHQI